MKSKKSTRFVTWKGLRYAFFNPNNRPFLGGAVALVLLGIFLFSDSVIGLMLFIAAAIVALGAVGSSLLEYNTADAHNKFALLQNWAKEAASEKERAERWAMLQNSSMDDVMRYAGLSHNGPRFNIDGTMMMPGNNMFDFNGNMYGNTGLTSAVYDSSTDSWVDPSTAYTSPLGQSDFSGSGSSMSGSDFGKMS